MTPALTAPRPSPRRLGLVHEAAGIRQRIPGDPNEPIAYNDWQVPTECVAAAGDAGPAQEEANPMASPRTRAMLYALGRVAGKQVRPGSPGRRVARRAAGTLARRGLGRLLRRW